MTQLAQGEKVQEQIFNRRLAVARLRGEGLSFPEIAYELKEDEDVIYMDYQRYCKQAEKFIGRQEKQWEVVSQFDAILLTAHRAYKEFKEAGDNEAALAALREANRALYGKTVALGLNKEQSAEMVRVIQILQPSTFRSTGQLEQKVQAYIEAQKVDAVGPSSIQQSEPAEVRQVESSA